ncbi:MULTISPECIES: helix-turn-helix domain-containing protein [Burkholderia cepacia complex]|jgi:transcriptional regulator with XRE-family HTH domain|uniref:helix-turn-helix domain-containing protein n=1 Tax=Burkholderia cepacia complex TaxID=87882 RepID=UPI0015763CAC|nr:helix-turn-helix transcriptional regulator [Burkholderia diffusa]NTX20253.1 helix-turn-helix transcriptional regulator [Burkholderia cepacia]
MDEDINDAQRTARMRLSGNLKSLRGAKQLSQEALAALAGVHRTYVSQVERGVVNVSLDNLVVLAQVLNVSLADLFKEPPKEVVQLRRGPTKRTKDGAAAKARRRKVD